MNRNYVIINGVNSLTIKGLAINLMPPITKPLMRTMREEIDGRNGDINTELGYQAYDKQIEVGLYGNYDIDEIIAFFNSKGTIVFSDENDKFYNFQILDKIDFAKMVKFRTAMINIHCQPFKYPTEETPLEEEYEYVTGTGTDITLNNTEETEFNKIELQGNTSQDGTPTPSNPIPIQVVSGDNEISICGKNLLKPPSTFTSNGITTTINEDGSLKVNGTASSSWFFIGGSIPIRLKPNTYVFSIQQALTFAIRLDLTYEDGTTQNTFTINAGATSRSATITKTIKSLRIEAPTITSSTQVDTTIKPMLEANTTATTWEAYNGETYPLYLGVENLFNKDNVNSLVAYIPSNGTITSANDNYMVWLPIKQNTNYTIKFTQIAISTSPYIDDVQIGLYTSTPVLSATGTRIYNQARTSATQDYTYQHTFNSGNNSYVAIKVANITRTNVTQTLATLQVEVGSKANHYSPYGTTPIEMVSIPNTTYKDLFVKETDTWYKREVIGKIILDGTETWGSISSATTPENRTIMSSNMLVSRTTGVFVSDHFIYNSQTSNRVVLNTAGTTYVSLADTITGILVSDTNNTKLTKMKNWLSSNNTIVFYVLETPTDIEITNETLIEQLEAIWNATSYRGQTNITQVSNDLPFMMEVSALKLGSDHLEINNTGNIYSKPTIELEGTGIVDIYLNDVQVFEVDLSEENKITIDTEKMEAYTDTGLANRKVTGDYSTFKLNVGTNDLRFSGALTSATITRYLRWL